VVSLAHVFVESKPLQMVGKAAKGRCQAGASDSGVLELVDAEQEEWNAASWLPEDHDISQTDEFYSMVRAVAEI